MAGKDGAQLKEAENPVALAVRGSQPYESRVFNSIKQGYANADIFRCCRRVGFWEIKCTFRDITAELEKRPGRFISTASHNADTSGVDWYLALAVNPQTATIDERAQYLKEAQAASKHLEDCFKIY